MSIPRTQTEIDAQAAHDALVAAANTKFIASVDLQIQEAVGLGMFWVNCITINDIDPKTIFDYYSNLGYVVSFPDFPGNLTINPSGLFGVNWLTFWMNGGILPSLLKKPYRFIISWKTPVVF